MMLLTKLEKSKGFWFLLVACFSFFILRFPSLFEPYWYGDEGVYQVLGLGINNGRLLYKDIWDNKPPLLYMIYSILGSDQFAIRFFSLAIGILSIILFYFLAKKIFIKNKTVILSTTLFTILFGLPLLEGNIANAENFMILPILSASILLFKIKESASVVLQNNNLRLALLSGILLGVAFLFKIVALFDFGAMLFFLIFMDDNLLNHLRNKRYQTYEFKKIILFFLGFIFLPLLTAAFFAIKGALPQFLSATFFSNIGYVGYGNKLLIPQGLLILKIAILMLFSYIVFLKRKELGNTAVFALLWFSFSLFNAFFSQRPYTHYLLVLLPSFCILAGVFTEDIKIRKSYSILFILAMVLILKNFSFYTKIFPYYGNFLSFEMGGKSVSEYQKFFDRLTPLDYELAAYIKTHTSQEDYIFTWGNNAQLYKLTGKLPPGKYTVAYHITGAKNGIKNTASDLLSKRPKLIIIMPYMNFFPFPLTNYSQRIIIDQASIYERVL